MVLHERVKSYKNWKEAETMLGKKREAKAKFEALNKADKISQAKQEISEVSLTFNVLFSYYRTIIFCFPEF